MTGLPRPPVIAGIVAGGLVTAACAVPDPNTAFGVRDFEAATPSCADPRAAWLGRVAGQAHLFDQARPVSFIGCFRTAEACDSWRFQAITIVNGVITQNACVRRADAAG